MENFWKTTFSIVIVALLCSLAVNAQTIEEKQKEVIIIEKVKDENGNIISKKVIRSSDGELSDEEIEKALNEQSTNPFDQLQNLNFDQGNFDFGSLFGNRNSTNGKPSLGVVLKSESDQVEIAEVIEGSGAHVAELRSGDIIISADGLVVNTIEELKSHIADRANGDKILLSIIRDGQSFDKEVELKVNNFNSRFGNFNPEMFEGFSQMFNFGEDGFPFNIDSIFQNLGGLEELKGLNDGILPFSFEDMPGYSDRTIEEDRPSLGVFIDETEGEGVILAEVVEDSPAEKAKLKKNDKILKIDGVAINSFDDLAKMIRAAGKNTKIEITYERNGKTKKAEVLLE